MAHRQSRLRKQTLITACRHVVWCEFLGSHPASHTTAQQDTPLYCAISKQFRRR